MSASLLIRKSAVNSTLKRVSARFLSDFVGYLKGKSALMIYDKHPEMGSKWDRSFWARGYYVVTVGNITEESVKEYIRRQEEQSKEESQQKRPL